LFLKLGKILVRVGLNDSALAELFRMGHGLQTSIPGVDVSVQLRRDKDRCATIFSELTVARKKTVHFTKKKKKRTAHTIARI